ncbi:phage tail tape measure protein [Brevibacterium sp. CT2-23B]|uniref:phage tail tape measure protein n=1 Tax=Brevibacterium sp. CT2-23B TaxID=2729630 RepID=UPI001554DB6E|nr:phage tail tape measure protein [Brevibacterium sp. CT2-23B]
MSEVRSVSALLSVKVNQFKADMASAGKAAVDAANKTETAWDKSTTGAGRAMKAAQQYSQEMTTVGTGLATFGGIVVGALGLATKATMSWESAWTGVMKTVDGTPRQLADIQSGLRDLAKTLPATHEEIAAVAEAAGQLGVKTDDVVSFTKTMIDLGEATNLTAEEAATSIAQITNVMGTAGKDVGRFGATLVELGNNGASTEKDILSMAQRLAGAGKLAGASEADILALSNAMASVGIRAELGGGVMTRVMNRMYADVKNGGEGLEELARVSGVTSKQFAQAYEEDPVRAVAMLTDGLNGVKEGGGNVVETMKELGIKGTEETQVMLQLAGAGDLLTESLDMGKSAWEENTALVQEASKRYETAESRIKIAGNQIKDTAITLGGTFAPAVAGVVEGVGDLVGIVGQAPEPVIKLGGALAGVVGSASLAAGGFLLLAPRIVDTIDAVNTLRTKSEALDKVLSLPGASKAKGVIGGVTKAAVAATGAVTALIAAGAVADMFAGNVKSTQELTNALIQLDDQNSLSVASLNQLFEVTGSGAAHINGFGDALDIINQNGFMGFLDSAGSAFGIFDSNAELAKDSMEAMDQSLSSMMSAGNMDMLESNFRAAAESAKEFDYSAGDVIASMPTLQGQLIEQAQAMGYATDNATLAKIALGDLPVNANAAAGAVQGVGSAAGEASDSLSDMLDGLVALGLANLDEREAMRQYEAAIDAVTDSIKENGTSLDITTEKGRNNQDALDGIASEGIAAAQAMAEHGRSQEDVQGQLQNTYDDLVAAGKQFGYGGEKAKKMAREILEIPDGVSVKSWMDDAARKEAKKTKDEVNGIPKKVSVNVVFNVTEPKNGIKNMPENLLNPNRNRSKKPGSLNQWEPNYYGNILTPMAAGGFSGAEMVKPNTWRIVGDRMDVDEAFIPLDGSRRSWEIMLEALNRMPGAIPMAKGGIASAEKSVDAAQDRLRTARREKSDAKSKKAKAQADRRVRIAEDELESSKKSLKAAKEKQKAEERAAKIAADRAKEERERRARVNDLRTDLRVDLRRGNIRDQVTGGLSGGYSAVDRLYDLGSNQDLSRGSRSRANSSARKFEANLRSLYAQAERIDNRLKKAQDKATELKGIKDSVASSLLGGRDLDVGTYQTRVDGQWQSQSNLGQAAKGLRMDVGAMKAFAGKLKKLTELGIPGAIIQEIAQAGVEEGSNMADSFIGATAAERKSYLGAWSDYEKYANQAGQYVTEGFYKGGSAAADGVVKGLEGKQKNVEAAIANLAKTMESTFKQVLGIHSPSRVMSELGGFTAEGLVQGMLGGVSDVQSAAAALGSAAVPNMMAFQPTDMSMDVGVNPVMADDEGMAGLAMQDMSTTTLEAMQAMGLAVSDGFAGMLANTQAAQAQMLLDTQLNQTGMLTATQAANLGQLTDTQVQHAAMLLDTQTQQEAMRATVLAKQTGQRTAATEQQELMRLMLIDKQSQMLSKSATDFESLKSTTGTKFSDMRKNTDGTMSGMYKDYDTRLVDLKGMNKRGFESLLSTSNSNMEGIKDGINGKMGEAKPVLGNRMNALIGVLSSFTASVNKAFGDVGVKLDAPKSLKFADGGVMPGYTPGRDVHQFYSPTAGNLHLSGGEAIMRPEWTRAMGGEAGVKAQNDAARQGRLDDLLHAQSQALATGGVFGRIPGVNAFADAGVWRNLWAITRDQFPDARLTSAYRGGSRTVSGNASYHSRGMAIDVSPSMDIFNFWRNKYGANLAELIYSPANGKQIKNGSNHYYTGAVRGMHFNHVHIAARQALSDAMAGGLPGMGGAMSHPFLDRAGVTAGSDLQASYAKAAEKLTQQIYAKHAKQLPDGIAGQLGKGIMSQVSESLIGKAKEYGKTTAVSGTTAGDPAVKAAVRKIAEQMGWGKYWGDIDWLVNKESSWNPNAANPSSSARGLFQKMTSLHGPVEDTVEGQARWGLNYIKSTYGNPAKARAHHQRSNWYEGGTERAKKGLAVVGEEGPELVNFQGGEQVMSTADSMKFMAANRTYIPTQSWPSFDASAFTDAVAQAVQGGGVTPEAVAAAMDGIRMTFVTDSGQFTGAVHAAVAAGYDQSRSRLSKSSQKIGAR